MGNSSTTERKGGAGAARAENQNPQGIRGKAGGTSKERRREEAQAKGATAEMGAATGRNQ